MATFDESAGIAFARDGQVITVDPGPAAHLRGEFPESGTLAQSTPKCGAPTQ